MAEAPGRLRPGGPAQAVLWAFPAGVVMATALHLPTSVAAIISVGGTGIGLYELGTGRTATAALMIVSALLLAAGTARSAAIGVPPRVPQGPAHFTGTVTQIDRGALVVDAEDIAITGDSPAVAMSVLVSTRPGGVSGIGAGDDVEVEATGLRRPGLRPGPRSAATLERLGVDAIATSAVVTRLGVGSAPLHLLGELRADLAGVVDRGLPQPAASLLLGIAYGWHGPIDPVTRAVLQDAGLIHIVAVSGLKVVIVAALIRALLMRLPLGRRWRGAALIGAIAFYVVLSGAGAAAVRSGLTAAVALCLAGDGRRVRPFSVLGLCATVMLAVSPRWLTDVGFQLSFLGTAGILLLADPVARRLPGPRLLAEPFAVTVAAQLATVPVMAGTFNTLSLVGPLANGLVLPLLPLLIVLGWSAPLAAVLLAPLGWLLFQITGFGLDAVILVARLLDGLPFAAIHVSNWPATWTLGEAIGIAAGLGAWRALRPSTPARGPL